MIDSSGRTFWHGFSNGHPIRRLRSIIAIALLVASVYSLPLAFVSWVRRVERGFSAQAERNESPREIKISRPNRKGSLLDGNFIRELHEINPRLAVVGNTKVPIQVEGPQGGDSLALQTLAASDPRLAVLGVSPVAPQGLGDNEVVVSDDLGELLFGADWSRLWTADSTESCGVSLKLRLAGHQGGAPSFRVVAHTTRPGRLIFANPTLGAEIRRRAVNDGLRAAGANQQTPPAEFDEVLAYTPQIDTVRMTQRRLSARYPDLLVEINESSLAKMRQCAAIRRTLSIVFLGGATLTFLLCLSADAVAVPNSPSSRKRILPADAITATLLGIVLSALLATLFCAATKGLLALEKLSTSSAESTWIDALAVDPLALLWVATLALSGVGTMRLVLDRGDKRSPKGNVP